MEEDLPDDALQERHNSGEVCGGLCVLNPPNATATDKAATQACKYITAYGEAPLDPVVTEDLNNKPALHVLEENNDVFKLHDLETIDARSRSKSNPITHDYWNEGIASLIFAVR